MPPRTLAGPQQPFIFADTEDEFDTLFEKLAKEGTVMMGPEAVEALRKVAWVTDKYGITWQLAFV